MLVKPVKRLMILICPVLVILYLVFSWCNPDSQISSGLGWPRKVENSLAVPLRAALNATTGEVDDDDAAFDSAYADEDGDDELETALDATYIGDEEVQEAFIATDKDTAYGIKNEDAVDDTNDQGMDEDDSDHTLLPDGPDYREIFSLTTTDRKFIPIFTGNTKVYNPNIIPHPTEHDLWIIVAQHEQSGEEITISEQVTCNGGLLNGVMVCTADPEVLPIEHSIPGRCEGDIAYFNFRSGPRDARMFCGPDAPYIVYGSQSAYTCLGIWLHDVRMLLEDFRFERNVLTKLFTHATEVQRPPPIKGIEKNFFLFWDNQGMAYVHHDVYPHRVFAQLSDDGSVGPDLAPQASNKDDVCLTMYMPSLAPQEESIHQASNSLSITFCRRSDPLCVPSDNNTFIFTIFQHKSYHDWHGIYEPHVMVFQRHAPFAIHAISQRPLWIHGRTTLTKETHSLLYEKEPDKGIPEGHTEMFYITSISWKTHGQRYHGYLDDPIFIGFGIEDTRAGVIDVLAEDLFQDLGMCAYG